MSFIWRNHKQTSRALATIWQARQEKQTAEQNKKTVPAAQNNSGSSGQSGPTSAP